MRTSLKTLLVFVPVFAAVAALAGCGDDNGPEDLYLKIDMTMIVPPVQDMAQPVDGATTGDAG